MTAAAFRLIMRKGPTPGQTLDLTRPEIKIGRELTNDLVINDVEVSRKQAILRLESGSYVIEDQGSTNGTFINGQRLLGPHSLSSRELITFGRGVELVYEAIPPDMASTMMSTVAAEPAPQAVPTLAPRPPVQVESFEEALPPASPPPIAPEHLPYAVNELFPDEPAPQSSRDLWLMAGFGCLVLAAVACAAAALAIEYFNLWCTLFGSIIPGC